MKTTTQYGSTIFSDNTVRKSISYTFDSLVRLKSFWEQREISKAYSWSADLSVLRVTRISYITSEEFFALGEEE
tara:strand:+ start:219 stop:440 length:222 start_codon:yes stop_codon:yes gene_type:complete